MKCVDYRLNAESLTPHPYFRKHLCDNFAFAMMLFFSSNGSSLHLARQTVEEYCLVVSAAGIDGARCCPSKRWLWLRRRRQALDSFGVSIAAAAHVLKPWVLPAGNYLRASSYHPSPNSGFGFYGEYFWRQTLASFLQGLDAAP